MSGIAVTSYSVNDAVYAIHWAFAIALTLCIVTVAIWFFACIFLGELLVFIGRATLNTIRALAGHFLV